MSLFHVVQRSKRFKLELQRRLYRRRCMDCGFLAAVARPDSSLALVDLDEVKPMPRQHWAHALRVAREMGKLQGSEYDPTMGKDLGLDEGTPHGVMCGLGRPEGPDRPTFVMPPRRRRNPETPPPPPGPGFVIRDPSQPGEASLSGFLGRVVAVVQTPVWPLVRPHSCPAFMKYREGLSPAEHVAAREGARRWKRDAVLTVGGVVLGAFLTWALANVAGS
jgi:hypothetical protein